MATRAERLEALERMTQTELGEFEKSFGGTWYSRFGGAKTAAIESLLTEAEHDKSIGNGLDLRLGLLTDDEQRGQCEQEAVEVAKSSARASWVSAHAAWVSVVISLVALTVAVIALVVALGE